MPLTDSSDKVHLPKADFFATTHWSVVLAAQRSESSKQAEALSRLCQTYWYPLYAFVRRKGNSAHDAQDLTQSFFMRLLEKDYLAQVAAEKGKFRSFLLAAMKHFLANEWDRARAEKRGGGKQVISIDVALAEGRYRHEPVDTMTADKIFERRWAMTVLDHAVGRLRDEQVAAGKTELYEALKGGITGERSESTYAELAPRFNLTEGAIKVAAHRLRRRYRELLREEIAQSVTTPEEVDEEIRHLFAALGN